MAAGTLWRVAVRFLHLGGHAGTHFELMDNQDVDRWLEEHKA